MTSGRGLGRSGGILLGVLLLGLLGYRTVVFAQGTPQIGILGKIGTVVGRVKEALDVRGSLIIGCRGIDPAVVSAPGTRVISDYCADASSLLAFDPTRRTTRQAAANISRLNREVARPWRPGGVVTGILCLRCSGSPQGTNPDSFPPEGKVWRVDGDLTLRNVIVQGRGTIIVNGNLTVEGNLTYDPNQASTSSVGFMVVAGPGGGGNITFIPGTSNPQQLVGAYLASGTIQLNTPGSCSTQGFDMSGSLVANRFEFAGRRTSC